MRHAVHIFPGFGVGGAQRRFATLVKSMTGWRHSVLSLLPDMSAAEQFDLQDIIHVEHFPLQKSKGISLSNVSALKKKFTALKPNLVCTYNWGSIEGIFASSSKAGHLHFEDGFGPDEAFKRSRPRQLLRRLAFRRSVNVVVPSVTLKRIAKYEWHVPAGRMHYLPNGIAIDRFQPAPSRPDNSTFRMGSVSTLRAEKNLSRFLDALGEARPDWSVSVVGDGPERQGLAAQAEGLGWGKDVFVGGLSDPSSFYQDLDVFVLSSDTEQMPLVVLEAMATGLPIVSTDVGDVRNMVCEENKPFIVAPENLGQALRAMVDDPEQAQRIGAANRERVIERFSERSMINSYQALFGRTAR